jgi:tRNA pseudouridine38-40 synthase
LFEGNHDFFNYSFCKEKDRKNFNSRREILSIETFEKKELIIIKFTSKGFLRYQIRAIIGEAINYCENKIGIKEIEEKLNNKLPKKYSRKSPSSGLYLFKIHFN